METKVMLVDDDAYLLESVTEVLTVDGFTVCHFSNGTEALRHFLSEQVDLVLTDIKMPDMSGIELMERIQALDPETPVILTTGYADVDLAIAAIQKGAFDFITKPYKFSYLTHAIEKAVLHKRLKRIEKNYQAELERTVALRTRELTDASRMLKNMSRVVIERLTAAAELRDEDTGMHIARIGMYSSQIARSLGMPDDFVDTIAVASAMHDVGKIGIPDAILLKPASLTAEEFQIMKTHTVVGETILKGTPYPVLQMAASIALNHHERWDGSGYPNNRRGEDIPIEGRIVMLADQYDALRSSRPYKPPFSHEKTCNVIMQGDGRTMPDHFDPNVLRAFRECASVFDEMFSSTCKESPGPAIPEPPSLPAAEDRADAIRISGKG